MAAFVGFAVRRQPCSAQSQSTLVHRHAERAQFRLGQLNLLHELLVRRGDVVEGEDAPAEAEEQQGAEADERPERQLKGRRVSKRAAGRG